VLFEEREIPNITHRIVVLLCRVPDVKLDIGETVIWVGAKAVLVLELESMVFGNPVLVVLSGGFHALAELLEGEELRTRHVPRQFLGLIPFDLEAPTDLASLFEAGRDSTGRRPALPFHDIIHDRGYEENESPNKLAMLILVKVQFS